MSHPNAFEVPDPSVILGRWIEATGLTQLQPLVGLPVDYGVHGEAHPGDFDTAALRIYGSSIHVLPIGRYDPVIQSWRFPPEYVVPSEQAPMTAFYRQQIEPAINVHLRVVPLGNRADLRDPHTVSVRQRMAQVMQAAPLDRLLERASVQAALAVSGLGYDTEVVAADEATFYYPVLAKGAYPVVTPNRPEEIPKPSEHMGQLTLCVRGLRVASSYMPGHTMRTTRLLPLAHKTQEGSRHWMPDLNIVTVEEWQELQVLPEMLYDASLANRKFSPLHAAVMRP